MGNHRALVPFVVSALLAAALLAPGTAASAATVPSPVASAPSTEAVQECRSLALEADGPLRSGLARQAFDVDGSGVTVGIISDSWGLATEVTTPQDDVRAGILPGPDNPCGYDTPVEVLREGESGTDEGRAMAQLVHGIAPGARLLFAAFGSEVADTSESVRMLADAGATIIVDDVSPVGELAFQRSELSQTIEKVKADGVTYLTSAGNETVVGAQGWPSAGLPIGGWRTDAYRPMPCPEWVRNAGNEPLDCLDFDPGAGEDPTNTIEMDAGDPPTFLLQWAEPVFGVVSNFDLQLYAVDGDERTAVGEPVHASADEPIVTLDIGGAIEDRSYDLVVSRTAAADTQPLPAIWIGQITNTGVILSQEYNRSSGGDEVGPSTYGHQSDGTAIAVGTVDWAQPGVVVNTQSIGPGTLRFAPVDTVSGTPSAALPEPVTVSAPSMVAVDGTRTSFFGEKSEEDGQTVYRFHGTSAAAPNAAGVLALAAQAAPDAAPEALTKAALNTAVPVSNPYAEFGFADENVTGAGRIDAFALLKSLHRTVRDSGRVIVYYQKQFVDGSTGAFISPLPLVTEHTGVDVVNLAAVHMNRDELKLNDLLPNDPSFDRMWEELAEIQAAGVPVVGMIGGAQNATWESLTDDYDVQYQRLRDFVKTYSLDGIDLDVETETDIAVVERVIADLNEDFGPSFLITLSPVTGALEGDENLSGFDYDDLYRSSGQAIDWFNTQFYCGWGEPTPADYGAIIDYQGTHGAGIPASKIVMAALTNPDNCGDGWIPIDALTASIQQIKAELPQFGGVAGWEYFNSLPGGPDAPWKWAAVMRTAIDAPAPTPSPTPTSPATSTPAPAPQPSTAAGRLAATGQDTSGLTVSVILGVIAVTVGAAAVTSAAAIRRRAAR